MSRHRKYEREGGRKEREGGRKKKDERETRGQGRKGERREEGKQGRGGKCQGKRPAFSLQTPQTSVLRWLWLAGWLAGGLAGSPTQVVPTA